MGPRTRLGSNKWTKWSTEVVVCFLCSETRLRWVGAYLLCVSVVLSVVREQDRLQCQGVLS